LGTCTRPVRAAGAVTCDDAAHIAWHKQYEARFGRASFPGVRRVIRGRNETTAPPGEPVFQVQLQPLGDTPGADVEHTFKAGKTYCLQTIQWACGVPIAWGKCYQSESEPQVLAFMNDTWRNSPEYRPSFLAYDRACKLLRHIVTQNAQDAWISTTTFIVDAWHYINHQATDILCRTRCNPAPADGSQPDLVVSQTDGTGRVHQTRAFNTETAEHFNSWLAGFESQLRQMTDFNFDFFVHALMLLYAENREAKAQKLDDDFWAQVEDISV
jgi:hypothetical protein